VGRELKPVEGLRKGKYFMVKWLIAGLLIANAAPVLAESVKDQARAVFEAKHSAVVTVMLTVKTTASFGGMGQDEESRSEVIGTVIRPDGLTIVSLSETDPMSLLGNMMPSEFADMFSGSSEVVAASIIVDRNREVPAEIVLRDRDLDLAFIRPIEAPESPFAYVDLSASVSSDVLDEVVVIGRLGRIGNRAHTVTLGAITSMVERPRRFYVAGPGNGQDALGSPVFNLAGEVVGVQVLRTLPGVSQDSGLGLGALMGAMDNVLVIVLPGSDIEESASQAPTIGDDEEPAADEDDAE